MAHVFRRPSTRRSARRAARPAPARDRRGVAMLLAIVAVASASILTVTYVSSREQTPELAQRIAESIESDRAAESAAAVAVAALQTTIDLVGDDEPETLFKDATIAGANVSVHLADIDGGSPDADDTDLLATAVATSGSVRRISQRLISRPPKGTVADIWDSLHSDFALLATSMLVVGDGASVMSWDKSPRKRGTTAINLAVFGPNADDFNLAAGANVAMARLHLAPSAGLSLKSEMSDARLSDAVVLEATAPVLPAALPTSFTLIPLRTIFNAVRNSGTTSLLYGKYQDLEVRDGAIVELTAGAGTEWAFNDLHILNRGVLKITGHVRIHVADDLRVLDESTIALSPDSSLTVYLADELQVDDSGVGVAKSVARLSDKNIESLSEYVKTNNVRIIGLSSLSGGRTGVTHLIDDTSIVVANIHLPSSTISVSGASTLVGRASAARIGVTGAGTGVYYDRGLDGGAGFSHPTCALFDAGGSLISGLAGVLKTIENLTDMATAETLLVTTYGLSGGDDDEEPIDGEPTPRDASAAVARAWPLAALAFEQSGGVDPTAGFVAPVVLDAILPEVNDTRKEALVVEEVKVEDEPSLDVAPK